MKLYLILPLSATDIQNTPIAKITEEIKNNKLSLLVGETKILDNSCFTSPKPEKNCCI